RLRDVHTADGLLPGSHRPPLGGLPQGRHHHGIEIQRNPAQLHVDDAVAHRALDQPRPDEPELQHLAGFRGDGVVARGVRRGAPGRPLDDDRDTGQRRALLTGYFSGNGLLLGKSSRSNQEYSHQHHYYALFHNELYGFWWTVSRAPTARSSTRALTYRGVGKTARGARNTMSPSRLPLAAALAAGLVSGCATNPATGARQLMLISESQEIAMGRDYDKQVVASIGLHPDSGLQRYLQQFGTRLAATSERPNLPWTFRVVDDPGLRYLRRGNYDPREMPHVFEMLDRVSQAQGGGRVPQWLATHPNPENRRGRIEQEIAAGPQTFAGTAVNRESYLQRLDGLVFGANPREGYFKGSQVFHPQLRIRITFPDGWTISNGKHAAPAVSPQQDAMVEVAPAQQPSADAAARAFLSQQGV